MLTRPHPSVFLIVLPLMSLAIQPDVTQAQLFGSGRQLGQPFGASRQTTAQRRAGENVAAQTQTAGSVQGNERFLRDNRRRGDFVGSDRSDTNGFVGSQQGRTTGSVLTSTAGIRPRVDRSRQINRPIPRLRRNQRYYPALQPEFEVSGVRLPEMLQTELENPAHFSNSNRYEVLVEGRLAILRGVVADARQKDLAALLVSFEPGISEVRNELQIQTPTEPANSPSEPTPDGRQVTPTSQ